MRMAVLLPVRADQIRYRSATPKIWKKEVTDKHERSEAAIVTGVIIGALLCTSLALWFVLRYLRSHHYEPKYLPGTWLKQRWKLWTPSSVTAKRFSRLPDRNDVQRARADSVGDSLNLMPRSSAYDSVSAVDTSSRTGTQAAETVDRHISVRSTVTLPAYSAEVRPTERIMGREGDREGIDTVLDFPETLDEEEERRDEEMESLYQIRQTRREERAAREERRRLRREARARGDLETVEALREQGRQARAAAAESDSDALLQQHRSKERGRRVSSVSYLDLGIARHDGSRVRANSNESDRLPLIDSAASMDGRDASRTRAGSTTLQGHARTISASSLSRTMTPDLSDENRSSAEYEIISARGSRANSGTGSRPSPRLRTNSYDLGEGLRDGRNPPQYNELSPIVDQNEREGGVEVEQRPDVGEQAPAYESPTTTGAPRLPGFARLPSIRITPFTPDVPTSDASFRMREDL